MQQRAYTDIDQWIRDIELMCDNAMQYNMEGSSVYLDAEAIKVRRYFLFSSNPVTNPASRPNWEGSS
jgi:hypothetical protein